MSSTKAPVTPPAQRSAAAKTPVRVRFAPSPTGLAHIGVMRSSLFNWLWARHTGGTFILRLEDTDRSRFVEGAAKQIYASHDALGVTPDEGPEQGGEYGPYVQSERKQQGIYAEHAQKLLNSGTLYPCWCSPERLTALREAAQKTGVAFKYDRHCLQPENQRDLSEPHVLRFRIPDEPATVGWDDAVRGHNQVRSDTLDDFVAIKADGYPTYHFANVVDDRLMKITHVLRADEWLPSTPKHMLLWQAFGWEPVIYAHLPAVQGPTGGKKLSKRDGAQSVQEYLDEGYLPEALRSFLATLGWNDGTTDEVYTTDTLIQRFALDRIQKSPARFDKDRLTWINGVMLRQMPLETLLDRARPFLLPEAKQYSTEYVSAALRLVQDRVKVLTDLPNLTEFFFVDPNINAIKSATPYQRIEPEKIKEWLTATIDTIEGYVSTDFNPEELEDHFRNQLAARLNLGKTVGPLFMLLRVVLTGRTATPGLFETMHVLGREATLRRLKAAQT